MTDRVDEIQPEDTTDPEQAVRASIRKRVREQRREELRERRARVRELMGAAEAAFSGELDRDADAVLEELRTLLEQDPEIERAMAPGDDRLDDFVKVQYRRLGRLRERDREDRIPLEREYQIYVRVAIGLGHIHAANDRTRMAPVTLEKLDVPGARSPVEGEPTPVGRVRIGAASTIPIEQRATEIPHKDCEHVLVIANPREGKDSLICRLAGNLKDEHGYKWVSLHDDGRYETPMIAIPADEPEIRQSLERFNQTPKGYKTRVYVPTVGLPDELPANHEPFTFGVDTLTTETVAQLSGVSPQGSTERRIKRALQEVRTGSGSVDELIDRLQEYADETTAEITVTELRDEADLDEDGDTVESVTRSFNLGEDKLLRECAQSLMMLSSEGLLRDVGAPTNLDMVDVLEDQEHVAVLNCNFLPDGDEHLKYLLENIWLRQIFKARDAHPSLPRVAIEIREIKELAPSTMDRVKYSKIIKALKQTLFFLTSQGGSRRVLVLGSTQYINDVYKPVRANMPIKILLRMGDEKIQTLESAGFSFSPDEYRQLKTNPTGWGMLLSPQGKVYPINWPGARCGLSLGDLEWLDRYGTAMGFRINAPASFPEDVDRYVDKDGAIRRAPPDDREWYLLPGDVGIEPDAITDPPVDVDDDVLEDALEARRDYPIEQDLRPQPVDVATEQREIELLATDKAEAKRTNEVLDEYELGGVLAEWIHKDEEMVRKFTRILEEIKGREIETYGELADVSGVSVSSIKSYANDRDKLEAAIEKVDGVYALTPVGERALGVDWSSVLDELDG